MKRGLYRVHGVDGLPDDVRIQDDGIEMPLEESLYRARGYRPPVDDLPWQEDYLAGKPHRDRMAKADPSTEKAARELARKDFLTRFNKR